MISTIAYFPNDFHAIIVELLFSLERFTKGLETIHRQLRRNLLGELGFNVNYEGIVMDIEPSGFAAEDGLKQSSRLVEVKISGSRRALIVAAECDLLQLPYF